MVTLNEARRSHVETVRDWPRGTRERGWGFLWDQVWFPADAPIKAPMKNVMCRDFKWYQLYLDRKMLWTPLGTLRIHTFYMGDEDGAVHSHPWWFVTFPLRSYTETVMTPLRIRKSKDAPKYVMNSRVVRAWRFHFRRATHRHFVHAPYRPFSTIILTGRKKNEWGFYPEHDKFVHHRDWTSYDRSEEDE